MTPDWNEPGGYEGPQESKPPTSEQKPKPKPKKKGVLVGGEEFTWKDVMTLRKIHELGKDVCGIPTVHLDDLADRIAAILPPQKGAP